MTRLIVRAWFAFWGIGSFLMVGCQHSQDLDDGPYAHTSCSSCEHDVASSAPRVCSGSAWQAGTRRILPEPAYGYDQPRQLPGEMAPATEPPRAVSRAGVPSLIVRVTQIGENFAPPVLAHGPDYAWISGELWYVPSEGVWKIHYGSGGPKDSFGNVLTLSSRTDVKDFQIGQPIYVEGFVEEERGAGGRPLYRITRVLPVVAPEGVAPPNGSEEEVIYAGIR